MTITSEHVATLRAYLVGNLEDFNSGMDRLKTTQDKVAFNTLLGAAFVHEMDQRFADSAAVPQIIEFVGKVRAGLDEAKQDQLDPAKAERLIRYSLGPANVEDIDAKTLGGLQIVLLTASIRDRGLSPEEIDAFLAEVRQLAEA